MTELMRRLEAVNQRIAEAEHRFRRKSGSVSLLAVSKTFPADAVAALAAHGQRRFGESYLQESLAKIAALRDWRDAAGDPIEWHFIAPIQANKTRAVAEHYAWVHGVDKLKTARRLNEQRPAELPALNVCIQVNVSGEASKAGTRFDELPSLAEAVAAMPRLRLRGLMTLPARVDGLERQREPFRLLRDAFERLRRDGLMLDTLSMGMSADLEAAIAEGATIVRVGSAIFGPRHRPPGPADPPAAARPSAR